MTKSSRYYKLVSEFKNYTFSDQDLLNPHNSIEGFNFEVINPWELWHNNLDAELMFIGQDFSDSASLIYNLKNNWVKEKKSSTNNKLITLFNALGYCFTEVNYTAKTTYPLFFTNAILGIKKSEKGDMSKPVKDIWWEETSIKYLRELIDIVQPKNIITMGHIAYKAVCKIYELKPESRIKDAIGINITLPDGKFLFPVQHCSPNGRRSRPLPIQINDWIQIRKTINP